MGNPTVKIVIHGSCITRDIFRIHPEGFEIVEYYARSCLSSVMAPAIELDNEHLPGLTSNFQKRMVINDFRKVMFQQLETHTFDYFLIDFIDERFNLLLSNSSLVTKSAELINSKYLDLTPYKFSEIRRLDYPIGSWKADCDLYINRLIETVPPERIIIIKGKWAEKYLSASGELRDFNGINHFQIGYIRKMNALMENYYDYLASRLPQAKLISYPPAIAHELHEWGLSPFHYLADQYDAIYKEIYSHTHH